MNDMHMQDANDMIQGVVIVLIILRILSYISFQPRLGVISGTLAKMLPELASFAGEILTKPLKLW
jgi:Polycystin cation channel